MDGDGWMKPNRSLGQSQHSLISNVNHEELMKSQDHVVWELNGGFVDDELNKEACETLWDALNSKAANVIVVALTVLEGLILLAELLIDLRIIQDPFWVQDISSSASKNQSDDDTSVPPTSIEQKRSSHLELASRCFMYISLTILSIFIFEMFLRIVSGKVRFFKQCMELFDAMVVFAAFALDLAFLATPKDGRNAAVFIVILRLWRVKKIVHSVIHKTKRQMSHIINAYKRDKIQAEHKVELLILKVEDLEHEVAYLKEKLKKAEKNAAQKKKTMKDSSPLAELPPLPPMEKYNPLFHTLVPLQRLPPEGRTESPPRDQDLNGLQRFAESTVKAILRTASNELVSKERWQRTRQTTKAVDDDCDCGDNENDPCSFVFPSHLKMVDKEDDLHASVLLGNSDHFRSTSSSELDELSEIERIRKIHFDPTMEEKGVPVTAL